MHHMTNMFFSSWKEPTPWFLTLFIAFTLFKSFIVVTTNLQIMSNQWKNCSSNTKEDICLHENLCKSSGYTWFLLCHLNVAGWQRSITLYVGRHWTITFLSEERALPLAEPRSNYSVTGGSAGKTVIICFRVLFWRVFTSNYSCCLYYKCRFLQDLSISTNTTHIKHTMESVFLYVDQLIAKEKGLQLQSDIPEKLCNINRVIVKILCSLYRMGETDHIALADRSEMIKSSVQGSTHHYNHTFKELFQRFHGFLCTLMKQNGGKTSPACSE